MPHYKAHDLFFLNSIMAIPLRTPLGKFGTEISDLHQVAFINSIGELKTYSLVNLSPSFFSPPD